MPKKCTLCSKVKPLAEFYYQRTRNCYRSRCKSCQIKQTQIAYPKAKARLKIKYSTPWYRVRFYQKRKRAKLIGLNFNLTLDEFICLKRKDSFCYYCESPLGEDARNTTVDRKDNEKGYTNDNCVVCCHRCNRLKSNFTLNDVPLLRKIIDKLSGHLCL